jgi:hypothetical protein
MTPNLKQGVISALSMGGYIDAASGRQHVFTIFLRDAPFLSLDDFYDARADQGAITAAIQQGY